MMKTFSTAQELTDAIGVELGHSDWLEVTQDRIQQFADATGDQQWIHVDVERAAAGPFGATIAHGYLTASLIPVLVQQIYRIDAKMGVNYGLDSCGFRRRFRSAR
ncbi:MaoC family dehydratase [Aeromicrobium sp. UC242_57]|uniref:MaoC family dehydratase n=1 Tax=Aeromicrobium sp. UC242_57 TaxID=3374624 RepID=UPI0037A4F23C